MENKLAEIATWVDMAEAAKLLGKTENTFRQRYSFRFMGKNIKTSPEGFKLFRSKAIIEFKNKHLKPTGRNTKIKQTNTTCQVF